MNPYARAQNYQMWRRGVSRVRRMDFDPVVAPRFAIGRTDKIATIRSCFAQHRSRQHTQIGFNYFVTESGTELSIEERGRRNFGVFSARYGNVYTTRQLLQLFQESWGEFSRVETAWQRPDGRFVDPYRPVIEPDGFASAEEVAASRAHHLADVRRIWEETDVLIFTLGLTETWLNKTDGSVFPLAPGTVADDFDCAKHAFENMKVAQVADDMRLFLTSLKKCNPKIRVLLTVSPVPLIATYENRNVLVATNYSKSVLRVAAEMAVDEFDWVDYFPSFEIITGSYNFGCYFEEDAREVNAFGVAHAMRCFTDNYVAKRSVQTDWNEATLARYRTLSSGVICDEEQIEAVTL